MNSKSSAGKGDKPRPYNVKRYLSNYEKIRWNRKSKDRRSYLCEAI